jgi:hypothetical protein
VHINQKGHHEYDECVEVVSEFRDVRLKRINIWDHQKKRQHANSYDGHQECTPEAGHISVNLIGCVPVRGHLLWQSVKDGNAKGKSKCDQEYCCEDCCSSVHDVLLDVSHETNFCLLKSF